MFTAKQFLDTLKGAGQYSGDYEVSYYDQELKEVITINLKYVVEYDEHRMTITRGQKRWVVPLHQIRKFTSHNGKNVLWERKGEEK